MFQPREDPKRNCRLNFVTRVEKKTKKMCIAGEREVKWTARTKQTIYPLL